ncbi:MAG TPA: glycoside hydrolase family 3 N-terminal domain-containing protein [Longimicrobiaceae bacterium]|jgi:beta-N-acetylhexosaminidase
MTDSDLREFGGHFLIGLQPAPDLTDHDRYLLERLRPAGVIVFKDNFAQGVEYSAWLERFARLLREVRGCIGRERILVCIDHEGGRVIRPPAPVTHYEYAREWADRAGAVGAAMAVELRSLGVNLDFAPVLDVDSNPANPVIGPRAFGTTPEEVAAAGTAFIAGLEGNGVLACPKHFPGHGDTDVDSHYVLPTLPFDVEQLRARELPPFAAAVAAGVGAVMTAHILVPSLDEAFPSTLSPRIVNGLLREELGYRGAVITDDVGMGATSEMFRDTANAARVIGAGCDLISLCAYWTDTHRAFGLAEGIARAAASGELSQAALDASRERIETLLRAAPQHEPAELPLATFREHAALAPARVPEAPEEGPGGTCIVLPQEG